MTEESTDSLPSFSDFFKLNSTNAYITMLFSLVFAPIFFFFFFLLPFQTQFLTLRILYAIHTIQCVREREIQQCHTITEIERERVRVKESFFFRLFACVPAKEEKRGKGAALNESICKSS